MSRGLLRLLHLRDQAEAAAADMIDERARIRKIRDAEPAKAISAFNLFQTPDALAERMVSLVPQAGDGIRILEPSAGLGRLYRAIRKRCRASHLTLIDSSPECCGELYRLIDGDSRSSLLNRDFLNYSPAHKYDCVVMNPPFKQGTDVKHIKHALSMTRPGGIVIALCFDGARQNKHLKPYADTWEPLGPDVFRPEGTRASVVLMTQVAT